MICSKLMDKRMYLSNAGIEELKRAFEVYLNSFQNKIYKISFDNNYTLSFSIKDINVPHLFGINTTLGIYKSLSEVLKENHLYTSYDLMEYMLNNREKFMMADKKLKLPIDYNNIIKKCRNFSNFDNLLSFNFIGMKVIEPINPLKSNFFIITENSHDYFEYSLLGIKDNFSATYPETIIPAIRNDKIFDNQQFFMPEKIEIIEKNKPDEKIISLHIQQQLLKEYRSLLLNDQKKLIKQA